MEWMFQSRATSKQNRAQYSPQTVLMKPCSFKSFQAMEDDEDKSFIVKLKIKNHDKNCFVDRILLRLFIGSVS